MSSDTESITEDEEGVEYMLGFAEKPARSAALLRHQFPSKVGGRPAWLDPVDLPSRDQLTCQATGRPLNFLLQLYAPLEDENLNPDAFHRSLFLFVTPQGAAVAKPGAVRAYRCQLPRKNPFYGFEPPKPEDELPPELPAALMEQSLAADPWRVLESERAVAAASKTNEGEASSGGATANVPGSKNTLHLYPELELHVEPEDRETDREDAAMEKLLHGYSSRLESEGELTEEELPEEVLNQVEENCPIDRKHFAMFQARMACAPDQVVRYCFRDGAAPLWPSPANLPKEVPPCKRCGAPRKFECQVMPQLLNHLQQDELDPASLDWGTIVVYTCSKSCSPSPGGAKYAEEYVWVQPP